MLLCRIKGKAFPLGGSRLKSELASALPLKPVFWSPDVGPSNCSREGQAAVKVTSLALPLPKSLPTPLILLDAEWEGTLKGEPLRSNSPAGKAWRPEQANPFVNNRKEGDGKWKKKRKEKGKKEEEF